MEKDKLARQLFAEENNCAQSVLAAFSEDFGLKKDMALKLSKNFGAGCLYRGEMCGAITGALMVYGLLFGEEGIDGDKLKELSNLHIEKFEKKHGTIVCKDLLGKNVGVQEELDALREENAFETKCTAFVEDSAKILDEILKDNKL